MGWDGLGGFVVRLVDMGLDANSNDKEWWERDGGV